MGTSNKSHVRRSQRDYTLGFKLEVVDLVEKGDMTYKQAQKIYGIQGRSTVLTWLRKHGRLDWTIPRHIPMPNKTETPNQKIKRLERENKELALKNLLHDEMLKYMDQHYGTSLQKKYFTRLQESFKKEDKQS